MVDKFNRDFGRQSDVRGLSKFVSVIRHRNLLALYLVRKAENHNNRYGRFLLSLGGSLFERSGIELSPTNSIGGGLLLVHPYDITINSRSKIGEDFTIFKGATIGSIRSGKKQGTPTIGNRVTVCANAMVCGKINIGDDVLIAANSLVNFDVPSNSVVIGNPGQIHPKTNPSADYLKK